MVTDRLHRERGSATIEMVILAPAFMLIVAMLVMGGRLAIAHQSIQSAATDAARAASIERGPDAHDRGLAAAESSMREQGLQCAAPRVDLDTSGKESAPGVPDQFVRATVTCDVALADLALPGIGGSRSVSATASSPIDVYRER